VTSDVGTDRVRVDEYATAHPYPGELTCVEFTQHGPAGDAAEQSLRVFDCGERLQSRRPVGVRCLRVSSHILKVPADQPSEVGHFQRGGRHFNETPAVRALEVSMLPVIVLGGVLGADETFRSYAMEVADNPHRAGTLAGRYAHSGAGRRAIEAMLIEASNAPPQALTTRLMNMSRKRAVYVEQPLADTDPKNALQERSLTKLGLGAEVVARRGARRCLECGAYRVEGYCESHYPLEHGRQERDNDAARVILRAAAEEMGLPADGPKARRVRRRATS
jgi:hypothetical protein